MAWDGDVRKYLTQDSRNYFTLATLALPVKVTELKVLASPVSSGSPAIVKIGFVIV